MYCTCNNVNEVQEKLQLSINFTKEWYDHNLLVVNCNKTNSMLVSTRQWSRTHVNDANFNVCIDENVISDADCIDYFGIKIDNNLSWSNQIDYLCKELRAKIGLFSTLFDYGIQCGVTLVKATCIKSNTCKTALLG